MAIPLPVLFAFAGNPYLISPESLLAEGLLHSNDLVDAPKFPAERVDFGAVIPWKLGLLDRSFGRFAHPAAHDLRADFDRFRDEESAWLADFSLFMALKEAFGGGSWVNWPAVLRARGPRALDEARQRYAYDLKRQEYRQFIFVRQWQALRERAASARPHHRRHPHFCRPR
jgi:4-alpha-glucanotransferase